MVDTIVDPAVHNQSDEAAALWGPYWSDISTGVIILNDENHDLSFARAIDEGATWATIGITVGTTDHVAAWYDKETSGNSGTLVHTASMDPITDDVTYRTVDVSDGALGIQRIVDATGTVSGTPSSNRLGITVAKSGRIYVFWSTQSEIGAKKSDDGGATWDVIADVFETATEEDYILAFPANTADDDDVAILFGDRSAGEWSIKMYDASANTYTETSIRIGISFDAIHISADAAIRLSDQHLLYAMHSNDDNVGDDMLTGEIAVDSIAAPTHTPRTNIFTNQSEAGGCGVIIDQNTDDVYVAYLKGGVWQTSVTAVYHKSTDGMATWDAESAYQENPADDERRISSGRTASSAGGRIQFAFYNDDLGDIFVNLPNDVEIPAAAPPPPVPPEGRTKGFTRRAGETVLVAAQRDDADGNPTEEYVLFRTDEFGQLRVSP